MPHIGTQCASCQEAIMQFGKIVAFDALEYRGPSANYYSQTRDCETRKTKEPCIVSRPIASGIIRMQH
eukprot:1306809-Amphidinium_carterae.1